MAADSLNQYAYDGAGRLCAVFSEGADTEYLYNADGQRVAKGRVNNLSCNPTSDGFTPTNIYVIGPTGRQLSETDGSGNWLHTNVFAGGKLLATYYGSNTYFALTDWLGTKRVETDSAGTVQSISYSLPFGDNLVVTGSGPDATEQHFTGKVRDSESGNNYFLARYYNSATGRFLSPDWSARTEPVPYAKLDNPQSLNLYAYVRNSPLYMLDPDGHGWWMDFGNGLADSTYRPFVQIAKHPVAAAEGISAAVTHPVVAGKAMGAAIEDTVIAAAHGNGRAIGQIVGTVGIAIAGGAVVRGIGVGADASSFAGTATSVSATQLDNLPGAVARIFPADIQTTTLGAPGAADVFVTDANAIRGMNASQIANGLTIPKSPSGFTVIEFPTPEGIASPINRTSPGFIGGGSTAGGLPEYVIPNGPIPANATVTHVP